ncbi:hypothetical protein BDZ89DRAFT_711882 [Hymenopellis radicata]|nr:hypothetical protein BDZ89DRAFT_711882 [Hymenopellis radicata]
MSLARERRKSEILLFAAADILEILKNATDALPFLSIATGIALAIVQKLASVKENKDRCRSTAERIVHVFLTIVETFRDADPNTVPPQTTRNVEQLQHRLNGILGCVEKITRRRKVTRFLMARTITAELEDLNIQLDDCLRLFQVGVFTIITLHIYSLLVDIVTCFDPILDGAPYWSIGRRRDSDTTEGTGSSRQLRDL